MTKTSAGEGGRSTISDIARLAGVSVRTVSRVLNKSPLVNDETRERVNGVIAQMDYAPDPQARALALRRSFLVGFIFDNPNPQYVLHMLHGLLDGVRGTGFEIVVHPREGGGPDVVGEVREFVQRLKLAGVVLPPRMAENEALAAMLAEIGCPYVRVASAVLDADARMIVTRERAASVAVARHLTGLGHTRLAHIAGPPNFRSSAERLAGFAAGLAGAGVSLDPACVLAGEYDFNSGVDCATRLLQREPRPTAIYAANDEMAAGAVQAAANLALRIPEDVSIVGYDDFDIASRLRPPLTSVRNPVRDVGRIAASRLVAQALGRPGPLEEPPEPALVVRASTAPPQP